MQICESPVRASVSPGRKNIGFKDSRPGTPGEKWLLGVWCGYRPRETGYFKEILNRRPQKVSEKILAQDNTTLKYSVLIYIVIGFMSSVWTVSYKRLTPGAGSLLELRLRYIV
jgi:hypothetical protein